MVAVFPLSQCLDTLTQVVKRAAVKCIPRLPLPLTLLSNVMYLSREVTRPSFHLSGRRAELHRHYKDCTVRGDPLRRRRSFTSTYGEAHSSQLLCLLPRVPFLPLLLLSHLPASASVYLLHHTVFGVCSLSLEPSNFVTLCRSVAAIPPHCLSLLEPF